MIADQSLTADELATIRARAEAVDRTFTYATDARRVLDDVPRLVAEIERLQAAGDFAMGVRAVLMSLDACSDEYEGARVLAAYREMSMPEQAEAP